MKINKILNNNLVLSLDNSGNEIIVKGKGVGFNKKRGDTIEKNMIEKTFTPNNSKNSKEIQQLLTEIPEKYLDFVQHQIDNAKEEYNLKLNNSIYISLSDHIMGTIKRFNDGIYIQNLLLLDIQQLYKKEYKISLKVLNEINRMFEINLPVSEAGFIALHFVNAQEDGPNDSFKIVRIINEILAIIKRYYEVSEFDEESIYYQRFITHLKYFAQRFLHKELGYNEDNKLFYIVRTQYPEAFGCVKLIYHMFENEYGYTMSEEEMLYLTIHISSISEKSINHY